MSKTKTTKETTMKIWTRTTDKYGRSVHHLRGQDMRTLAVVVKVPKQTAHHFEAPYFTNNWSNNSIEWHPTLKEAKSYLEATV